MRILFDHQIFSIQRFGGISRYFAELIRHLGADRCGLSLPFSNNAYLPGIQGFRGRPFLPNTGFKGKNRLLYLLNGFASSRALSSGRHDLFHPTYYDPYFLPSLRGRPFVLTIYDMIHEIFPGQFLASDPSSARKRLLAQKAARIIAISETTKRDIIRFYGVTEDRIKVIHLCDSFQGKARGAAETAFRKYFLFVGKRQVYKNFAAMVRAMAPLFREDPSLNLIFTGGDRLTPEEIQSLEALGGAARWAWMNVPDAQLESLYRGALALVFPSLYEGFGIPILEAFRSGCPALLSRSSCFPEIAADAALYFDPDDPADFEAKLRLLAHDPALRDRLVQKGYRRVEGFSWEKSAQETLRVYEEALGL